MIIAIIVNATYCNDIRVSPLNVQIFEASNTINHYHIHTYVATLIHEVICSYNTV